MANIGIENPSLEPLGSGDGSIENLLTIKEVAHLLRLTPQTLYKMLKQGDIPAVKIGSQWRFDAEQVRTWLLSRSSGCNGK